ncbi:MAG: Meiotic Sister-Chromatid recombination aldehyde dehydrogenase [Thelocarpon impressellum]|nr:MAG: Meiotic Sister-Chromatid recombination aldehyde dehydrogenase [Thelocarpon impressellum]
MDRLNWGAVQDGPGSGTFIQWTAAFIVLLVSAAVLRFVFGNKDEKQVPSYTVAQPAQCEAGWEGDVLEKPQLKVPGSSAIQCYSPATGRSLSTVNPASAAAVDRAVKRAAEAQREWAKTSFAQRRRVLRTLLKFILENQEAISTGACLDSGKTRIDSSFGEILVTVEKLKWTILHGERALKAERRPTNFLMSYKINEVRWEPLGVVAACVSWNYPFHNLLGPVISAIFAGNGIVVKGSEATAWSSSYFADIACSALKACGHSPHLVQSVVCWPSVAPSLTSHPGISHLTFIGSRPVAHAVAASAAKSLTPVCVELGGKDAAVILDDVADISKVASILMRGVFQSAGQNCIGIERVIACAGIYDRLVAILEPRVGELRVGSALDDEAVDVGAMISGHSFDRLERLVADAVAGGARCLAGGRRYHHPRHPNGHYFSPTLLVDVTPEMRVAQEEAFAPIMTVMRATDVSDAIRMANSTAYGLGASVFGRDAASLERVVSGSRTGMVSVNDFAVYYAVQLPFGGVGGSGYGRFAAEEGLRALCNTKAVCRDRFPGLLSTAIPRPLDYPIADGNRAWDFCQGIVELGYGESLRRRVAGLGRLVRGG